MSTEQGAARANLPHAQGKVFHDLDSYLAHLKRLGTMDFPFWEEVKPGLYRHNTGRGMDRNNPEMATRAELLRRFGFAK